MDAGGEALSVSGSPAGWTMLVEDATRAESARRGSACAPLRQMGWRRGLAPFSPDSQAVSVLALMNSRGERHFRPECGWLSF